MRIKTPRFIRKRIQRYLCFFKDLITPKEIYENVEDIILDSLYYKGYTTLILDIDNTLVAHSSRKVTLEKINWIRKCKNMGFRIFLVSNNSNVSRVLHIANQVEIYEGLYFACKPFPFSLYDLAETYGFNLEQCAVIGDQLFTDIILGNWISGMSILVDPVNKRLSFFKTLQREVELFFLRLLSRVQTI